MLRSFWGSTLDYVHYGDFNYYTAAMKVIQTQLDRATRRAGEEIGFTLSSLLEIPSKELGEIDSYRGSVCMLVLTDSTIGNVVKVDIDEILENLPENDALDNYKSPSKRLRDILWRLQEQDLGRKPTKEEFADYYKREYDKISSHYKDKFDEEVL